MRPFEQCIALVVNDDPFQRQMIAGALRHDNLLVHTCEGAAQALATMRIHGPPDIIITDLHMPGIDGWQLCWLLRSTICPAYNHIPIMVVAATHILKEAADIKTLGADDFLAAPCSPAQIRRQVRQLLEGSSRTATTASVLVAGADDGTLAICKSFAKTGYSACHAPATEVAVSALDRQKISLVIIHHSIAADQGAWLLGACRAAKPQLPILVVTPTTCESTAVELLRSGAAGCVPEPVDLMELHELCRRTLRTRAIMAAETLMKNQAQAFKSSECHHT